MFVLFRANKDNTNCTSCGHRARKPRHQLNQKCPMKPDRFAGESAQAGPCTAGLEKGWKVGLLYAYYHNCVMQVTFGARRTYSPSPWCICSHCTTFCQVWSFMELCTAMTLSMSCGQWHICVHNLSYMLASLLAV